MIIVLIWMELFTARHIDNPHNEHMSIVSYAYEHCMRVPLFASYRVAAKVADQLIKERKQKARHGIPEVSETQGVRLPDFFNTGAFHCLQPAHSASYGCVAISSAMRATICR